MARPLAFIQRAMLLIGEIQIAAIFSTFRVPHLVAIPRRCGWPSRERQIKGKTIIDGESGEAIL